MNEAKHLHRGEKFAHATVGKIHNFEGKQFIKDATGATSCEISFGTLPTDASVPFFHSHKKNEENYMGRKTKRTCGWWRDDGVSARNISELNGYRRRDGGKTKRFKSLHAFILD